MSPIDQDVVAEGSRLLARATEEGVPLRLLGGVAIKLRAPGELAPAFARSYADLDFVTSKKSAGLTSGLFRSEGYEPHTAFNALHGGERLLFFDNAHDRQVDAGQTLHRGQECLDAAARRDLAQRKDERRRRGQTQPLMEPAVPGRRQ